MSSTFRSLAPTLTLPLLLAAALPAQATIGIASGAASYSQSFDSLATSGAALPWANDATLAGWSLFNFNGVALTSYAADTGSSSTGAFKSYGANGSSERAFGGLGSGSAYFGSPASGAIAGWFAVAFTNTGAAAFEGFTASFDGEQWRNGGNTSAQTMVLEYGFGNSFGTVGSWTATGFDFTSPVVGSVAAAVDGNGAGRVAAIGGTRDAAWAPGQTLWLRWTERNDSGNDHGLAIDNFTFSAVATPVPEPGAAVLLLAGLVSIGFIARRR